MRSPGQQPQHARSVVRCQGLAENLVANNNYRVRTEDGVVRAVPRNGQCLFAREPFSTVLRGFSRQRIFRNLRRLDFEGNPRVAKEFLSSRRGGSEHEHAAIVSAAQKATFATKSALPEIDYQQGIPHSIDQGMSYTGHGQIPAATPPKRKRHSDYATHDDIIR